MIILIEVLQTKYLYYVETIHIKNLSKQFRTSNSNQREQGMAWRMGQREPEHHVDRNVIPTTPDNKLGHYGKIKGGHGNIPEGSSNILDSHSNIPSSHSNMPGDGNMPGSHGNNIGGNVSHIFPAIQNNSINMATLQHKLRGKMTSDKLLQSSKYWKRKCHQPRSKIHCFKPICLYFRHSLNVIGVVQQ